ncbi:hypothetical protein OTU49_009358 [Cherax quadricarinatus]|uniref:Uncharacterized protein n=2 Tax=Cherax quadricarinatus TaxID=27406 RepID=A0AAW0YR47_CHEQU|nr:uncharacterized protein LOC128686890 isoform X1 [Cherax quadricarinatus]
MMKFFEKKSAHDGARQRVYWLGIISMVMALGQVVMYLLMLHLVITPEHRDNQVLGMCAGMAAVTAVYIFLTGRLLFLLYEKRFEETTGPEWLWWFATMVVVLFNGVLVVWFSLMNDVIPATLCSLAFVVYVLFFKFAKDDIKCLRQHSSTHLPTQQ